MVTFEPFRENNVKKEKLPSAFWTLGHCFLSTEDYPKLKKFSDSISTMRLEDTKKFPPENAQIQL